MMLAQAGRRLGLEPVVLAASKVDPAAQLDDVVVVIGARADRKTLANFLTDLDYVFVDQELDRTTPLREALQDAASGGRAPVLVPSMESLSLCSDKLEQKRRLRAAGLPTPPWLEWSPSDEAAPAWTARVASRFPHGAVLKLAHGGYDGRGISVIPTWSDTSARAAAEEFCAAALKAETPVYAEAYVPFKAELAVVSTRWRDGRLAQYPVVETRQSKGVCVEVLGPAAAVGIDADAADLAAGIAARIGAVFDLTGTYAVEMFLGADGRIDVNEIAPRVHNSGHFTQTAAVTSQFESHWRAGIGLDPGSFETKPLFAMVNVLGAVPADLSASRPFGISSEGIEVVWYNKQQSRPGRKLGHVNVLASSLPELRERMAAVTSAIKSWNDGLVRSI
jgi:5-(carboxyamino)imidazole ribonucleotide synthase